jgi:hypothetical protein
MASVKTCTICFGIGPSASWDESCRQLPGLSSQRAQGAKTGCRDRGQSQKPILGRNSGTDLAPMHCSNYSLGIVRAASDATIFELCKSDILQIKHPLNQTSSKPTPPNQYPQINTSKSTPPNQHLQINTSKSTPPNQHLQINTSKSSILQITHHLCTQQSYGHFRVGGGSLTVHTFWHKI